MQARRGEELPENIRKVRVLDNGYVELIDWLGDDGAVVEAARQSTTGQAGTPEEDRKLIRYLMKNRHTSPFEMVDFVFDCKMPIFVARQWVRHRTASLNEYSGRYSRMISDMYLPPLSRLKESGQGVINKQGSEGHISEDLAVQIQENMSMEQAVLLSGYDEYLARGISKEIARVNTPVATYTKWRWKMNLHNMFHFFGLRLDEHAQWEMRQYAWAMYGMVKAIAPVSCEAWEDFIFYAHTTRRMKTEKLRQAVEDFREYAACDVSGPSEGLLGAARALFAAADGSVSGARRQTRQDPSPSSW